MVVDDVPSGVIVVGDKVAVVGYTDLDKFDPLKEKEMFYEA